MFKLGNLRGGPNAREEREKALDRMQAVLIEAGQGLAGRLAALTAPMSKDQGDRAAARDITALFGGKVRVARILKETHPGRAAAWLEAIDQGASRGRIRRILKGTKLDGVEVLDAPDEGMHLKALRQSRRKRQGRKIPKAIVRKRDSVRDFLRAKQGHVGMARKGWHDARAALGGTGGGAWPSGRAVGGARVTRAGNLVRVTIRNEVRHARFLMSYKRRQGLIEEARKKALAGLKQALGGKPE